MIISGGVNIYPAEIEAALSCHPAVADVAVFGVPHDDWGEEIKAVVQPAPGRRARRRADRRSCWRSWPAGSPGSSCRAAIDFVDELPRDPNGKLYKRKLRDPYWAGRDRAI